MEWTKQKVCSNEFRLFRGVEISRNSIPNHSGEEKTIRNSVRRNKNTVEANFRNFVPKHFVYENMLTILFSGTGNFHIESLSQNAAAENFTNSVRKDDFWRCFVKLLFSRNSVSFRASELTILWTSECLRMSTFFRGIIETVLSLFKTKQNSQPYNVLLCLSKILSSFSYLSLKFCPLLKHNVLL
jgi:hypothetical protein